MQGTDADKLDVLFEFSKFLLTSVESDCLNMTNWETRFWYTWASDGKQVYKIDSSIDLMKLFVILGVFT